MQYSQGSSIILILAGFLLTCATTQQNVQPSNATEPLKCYVCNSVHDPRCGDPFNPRTIELVACHMIMPEGKNATVCRKNVQKVSLGATTDVRVIRACGYEPDNPHSSLTPEEQAAEPSADRCYRRTGTFEIIVHYCSCHGSACNSGEKVVAMGVLGSLVVMLCSVVML